MAEQLFDVFVTGELVQGAEAAAASQELARLFKTTPERASAFVGQGRKRLKGGLDRDTAQQYRAVLHKAGLMSDIKPAGSSSLAPSPSSETPSSSAEAPPTPGEISLAPVGTAVLTEEERATPPVGEIDTSAIQLQPEFSTPPDSPMNEPPVINTEGFSVAPSGSDMLPNRYRSREQHSAPNTEHMSLSEVGANMAEPSDDTAPPAPSTDHLSVAPAGETIETLPKEPPKPAPSTDHLSISD